MFGIKLQSSMTDDKRGKNMKSIKKADILITIVAVICITVLSACNTNLVVSDKPVTESGTGKILVMPVKDMAAVYGENMNVRCPICGKVFLTGKAAPGARRMLTEQLFKILKKKDDYKLLSPDQARGIISKLLAENKTGIPERDLLIKAGSRVQAYAVMAGYLYRFRERIGKRYSVESPASVAFDFHLIRVSDGRVLWGGNYDETQRALSEDILHIGTFLKRNAEWITADKMAKEGIKEMFELFKPIPGN